MKTGSSCAAVTGYDSPFCQSPDIPAVKAGRRPAGDRVLSRAPLWPPKNQEPEHFAAPLSFAPSCVRTGAKKLLRKKEE